MGCILYVCVSMCVCLSVDEAIYVAYLKELFRIPEVRPIQPVSPKM